MKARSIVRTGAKKQVKTGPKKQKAASKSVHVRGNTKKVTKATARKMKKARTY